MSFTHSQKRDFEPSAPPQECRDDATKCWNKAVNSPAPPTTPGTGVRRHFSNASSVPNRWVNALYILLLLIQGDTEEFAKPPVDSDLGCSVILPGQ